MTAILASYRGPYQDIIFLQRPASRRLSMPVAHRAKQFAPFAALKGFEDCVRKKEEIYVPYLELSDESKEDLDRKMRLLKYHELISLTYFKDNPDLPDNVGQYKKITGTVEYIDPLYRYIRIGDIEVDIHKITDITADQYEVYESC